VAISHVIFGPSATDENIGLAELAHSQFSFL
jgi:hypothetical protein